MSNPDGWPIVLTLYESPEGVQRVSRVTAHGEEIVATLPVEVATVCSLLYRTLGKSAPSGGVDALQQLARLADRMTALEAHIQQHMVTGTTMQSWLEEWIPKLTQPGASTLAPPVGQ